MLHSHWLMGMTTHKEQVRHVQYKLNAVNLTHWYQLTPVAWDQITMETSHGDSLPSHSHCKPANQNK